MMTGTYLLITVLCLAFSGVYDGAKKLAQLMCGGTHRIKTLIVERKVQP